MASRIRPPKRAPSGPSIRARMLEEIEHLRGYAERVGDTQALASFDVARTLLDSGRPFTCPRWHLPDDVAAGVHPYARVAVLADDRVVEPANAPNAEQLP